MAVTRYLADKSALARLHLPAVREELEPLIMRALVGICGVTELEMLFSARNIQERSRMKEQLAASLDRVDTPQDIWDQAAEIQEALTEQAQHRSASIPDLIVAATARARGLEILHYDRDFDTIARYTEQAARWIVPPGTVLPPPAQHIQPRQPVPCPRRISRTSLRYRGWSGHGCRPCCVTVGHVRATVIPLLPWSGPPPRPAKAEVRGPMTQLPRTVRDKGLSFFSSGSPTCRTG